MLSSGEIHFMQVSISSPSSEGGGFWVSVTRKFDTREEVKHVSISSPSSEGGGELLVSIMNNVLSISFH